MLISWKPIYDMGVDYLDADHRHLVDLINAMEAALRANRAEEAAARLPELVALFDQHCLREEAAMRKAGFDQTAAHAGDHGKSRKHLADLAHRAGHDPAGPVIEAVVEYLRRWFFDHVVGRDLQFRSAYRDKGLAAKPAVRGLLGRIDHVLSGFRMRTRIIAAALIPTLVAIGLTVPVISAKVAVVAQMDRVRTVAARAVDIGNLVHELQLERGLTASRLAGDESVAPDLRSRRETVDHLLAGFGTDAAPGIAEARDQVGRLRSLADGKSNRPSELVDGYSAVIARLLGDLGGLARQADDDAVGARLTAYLALAQGKERAGQERAIGAAGFHDGFALPRYQRFLDRAAQQSAYFEIFRSYAPAPLRQALSDALAAPERAEFAKLREAAVPGLAAGTIDSRRWFDAATARIDAMKRIETADADEMRATAAAIRAAARRDLALLGGFVSALLLASIALTVLIVRSVVRPFAALEGSIARIASGETDAEVVGDDRKDEIGEMARTVLVFRGALLGNDMMRADQVTESAFRELQMKRREGLTRDFDAKVSDFVGILAASSTELVATANEMTRVAGDTAGRSATVAAASEQTSANIQTVAAAVEELAATISEVSRQVTQAATTSAEAVHEAERTDAIVLGLGEAADRIGSVAALIEQIASRTNLLALNATIEAARAGDAGKGFAVVASEVKSLAMQTARATGEIGAQIKAIQEAADAAETAIRGIGGTIREIGGISQSIAAAVEQQNAATAEISRNIVEAAKGVEDVNGNIVTVSDGALHTGSAASQVLQAANDVSARSELIRAEVVEFLTQIRVA